MDMMSLITGGAQPQFDERFGAPQADPNLENLLRAIAMQKMQAEPVPQAWPDAGVSIGFQNGAIPQPIPNGPVAGPAPSPDLPAAVPPNDGMFPTDFSGSPRQKIIRAPDAAPDFPIGMPMQAQPSMQDMVPSRGNRTMNNLVSGFGSGIAKMPGNTRGAAIGRGFGGATAGYDAAEKEDFNEDIKLLDTIKKAALSGDEQAYKSALAQYYQAYAAKMRAEIGPDGQRVAGTTKLSAPERMRDWIIERYKAENNGKEPSLEQLNILMKNPTLERRFQQQLELSDIREAGANARSQARTDSQNFRRDAPDVNQRFQQNRGMVTGRKPAEQPLDQPAQKPAEIKFPGNGSQASPYKPAAEADYNEIPVGSYYQHPADPPGKLRIKGKGPA